MINCENTQSSQLIAAKYSNLKAQVFQIKYAYKSMKEVYHGAS
jgi:hypothetical protein